MHFQPKPYDQKKRILIIKGRISGLVLDLREKSKTFGKIEQYDLDSTSGKGIVVPAGCAWGFLALEDESIILYSIQGKYNKECDFGINVFSLDLDIGIDENTVIISRRDKELPSLREYIEKNMENNDKNE